MILCCNTLLCFYIKVNDLIMTAEIQCAIVYNNNNNIIQLKRAKLETA